MRNRNPGAMRDSRICTKIVDDPVNCMDINTPDIVGVAGPSAIFDDDNTRGNIDSRRGGRPAATALTIGAGFHGYMRKVKIYDYAKVAMSLETNYKRWPMCF